MRPAGVPGRVYANVELDLCVMGTEPDLIERIEPPAEEAKVK